MTELSKFTVEGDLTLGYFTDAPGGLDRRAVITTDADRDAAAAEASGDFPTSVGVSDIIGTHVEQLIARNFDFPNDAEFTAFHRRLNDLREQGLRPDGNKPDITREGVRLKITVEVLD